jgi:hypothetical protein
LTHLKTHNFSPALYQFLARHLPDEIQAKTHLDGIVDLMFIRFLDGVLGRSSYWVSGSSAKNCQAAGCKAAALFDPNGCRLGLWSVVKPLRIMLNAELSAGD